MIRISQIKLPIEHKEEELLNAITKSLKLPQNKIRKYAIIKKSIDARKKNEIKYIYTIDVTLQEQKESEQENVKRCRNENISVVTEVHYEVKPTG
jgi:uncharacterized FAD-dependent dehydrogenase